MSTEWAVPHINGLGDLKWQPQLPDGERAWVMSDWIDGDTTWGYASDWNTEPVLYRYHRAVRIAKAEHQRRLRDAWEPLL